MQTSTNKTHRVKYTEQTAILLSPTEKEVLNELKIYMKGTNSQVFRFAITRLAEDLGIIKEEEKNARTE